MSYPLYTVWDVETSIRSSFKRKANPFDPENFVVMSGWKRRDGKVVGDYFGRASRPLDWFTKLLDGTKVLVGQNIKFDLLHAFRCRDAGEANHWAWMKWVADGGIIWDVQLAEYLLEGMPQASHMMSMDDLVPRYGGNLKIDEVKSLWEAGISTEDIDKGLLTRYLCGTFLDNGMALEHGDIGNTELIWLGQYERAKACGQVKSILMNMGSLLCTVEMELNGMAVDLALGHKQAEELAQRLAELTVELTTYLPEDLPFDFNWASGRQKSALIFGGTVNYEKYVWHKHDDGSQVYAQKDIKAYYHKDGSMVPEDDERLADPMFLFENALSYASGKNAGEYKSKKIKVDDLSKPKGAMRQFPYTFPGYTQPSDRWKSAVEGVWSTAGEVIEALGNRDIPFLKSLSKVTALSKDLTTYYIVIDPDTGEQKGMLTLVQADGIIHHMLNHTSTVTARFSSSNPNLQNLPKEGKSVVKTLFVSRFKGGKIIQSDFTALEVYVQAILTRCKQLILDLIDGLDMHCARVASKEGVTYEEAVLRCKGDRAAGVEPIKEWSKKRTDAKVFSFQRAYGAGAQKISDSTGIPKEDVEALIVAENARYPEVERFYEKLTEVIKANSVPSGNVAQHPDIPGLNCFFRKSYYRTPDNKLYSYKEGPSPEFLAKKGTATSFSPTEIKNYIVQGEGGEWAKAAMWLAIRAFYKRKNFGGQGLLVNQVHDALYADADGAQALEVAALLEACMVAASEFMEWYFGWTVPVPVPSETVMGDNMMDEHTMPDGFRARVRELRLELRADYMGGYEPSFEAEQREAA